MLVHACRTNSIDDVEGGVSVIRPANFKVNQSCKSCTLKAGRRSGVSRPS